MTWLAVVATTLAAAIFVAGRKFRGKPSRIREPDRIRNRTDQGTGHWAGSYESRRRFAPRRGADMKKWKDADYNR